MFSIPAFPTSLLRRTLLGVVFLLSLGLPKGAASSPEIEALLLQESFPQALQMLQAARAGATEGKERDELSLQVVRVLLMLGRVPMARIELGRLTDREAPYPQALIELARLHLEFLEEEPGALDRVDRALHRAEVLLPSDPGLKVQWGNLARARGRLGDAVRRYQWVVEKWLPGYPRAYFGLARARLEMGQGSEAVATMKRALERHPLDAETHWFAGNIRWAVGGENWLEETLGHYQDAMGLAPQVSRYKGAAMVVNYFQQDRISAEPILALLEVESPHGSYTWLGRGLRQELGGKTDAARNSYRMALSADARNYWASFLLGGILGGRGNPELTGERISSEFASPVSGEEARGLLRRVARQAPEFPFREALTAALRMEVVAQ